MRRFTQRDRVDAAITRAIRSFYAAKPQRAEYEVKRYLDFMAAYREKLGPEHGLSQPAIRHLQHMAACGRGWPAASARQELKGLKQ